MNQVDVKSSGRRPAQRRSEARRLAVLEAVIELVEREGSAAVTHRRVAEVAGVSLSATTYYFASKQELISEALALLVERETAHIRSRLDALQGDRLSADDVANEIAGWYDDSASHRTWLVLLELGRDGIREGVLVGDLIAWNAAADELVQAALELAGDPQPLDARTLRATADGMIFEQLYRRDPDFVDSTLRPTLLRLVRLMLDQRGGR